jgi:hypothetical protein
MTAPVYEAIDDSGFLALIDPDAYVGFVDENWSFEQLCEHFLSQMREHHLLIWDTGMEFVWRVCVALKPVEQSGFREVSGFITSTDGWLLLTSYDSLTMAAQFEDVTLPEPQERNLLFRVEPGMYRCRIVQLHNHDYIPEPDSGIEDAEVHYIIELLRSQEPTEPWSAIPWFEVR